MTPKTRIRREEIILAAASLVRTSGEAGLNARSVSAALGCSTQPVFSNFASMEELRLAVIGHAEQLYQEFAARENARGIYPTYKASGMAYIRFAKEETELFRLLFMRSRAGETIPERTDLGDQMERLVHSGTGLDADAARLFHLEMWACVHGIASMIATGYLQLEEELISRMLTDTYQGLKKQFERK